MTLLAFVFELIVGFADFATTDFALEIGLSAAIVGLGVAFSGDLTAFNSALASANFFRV